MFDVRFRCGHDGRIKDGQEPCCGVCGARGVARLLHAPTPRITGAASGPYVTTQAVDPATVVIGTARLALKDPTHGDE